MSATIVVVADWPDIEGFTWEEYLATTKSQAVPARAFKNVSCLHSICVKELDILDRIEFMDPLIMIFIGYSNYLEKTTSNLLVSQHGSIQAWCYTLDNVLNFNETQIKFR